MERSILECAADVRDARTMFNEAFRVAKEAGIEHFVFEQTARRYESLVDSVLSEALFGFHEMRAHLRREVEAITKKGGES